MREAVGRPVGQQRQDFGELGRAAGCLLLLLVPFWLSGRTFMAGDNAEFEYPYLSFLRSGAGWNPYAGGGLPAAVASQGRCWYPLNAFFLVFDPVSSMLAFWALNLLLGLAGAFGYLRWTGRSARAAATGGLAYALAAPHLMLAQNHVFLAIFTWAPWLLWALERAMSHPGWRQAAALALVLGVIFHGNGWQLVALYLGTSLLAGAAAQRPGWRGWCTCLAGFGGALMLAAPVVFTWLTLRGQGSVRATAFAAEFADRNALNLPGFAVACFAPWFGPLESASVAFDLHLHEHAYGVGLCLLPLLWAGRRCPRTRVWAGMLAILAVLALGPATPVLGWARAVVPLLANFRVPVRLLDVVPLAVMVAAAAGVDAGVKRGLPVGVAVLTYGVFCWLGHGGLVEHGLLLLTLVCAVGASRLPGLLLVTVAALGPLWAVSEGYFVEPALFTRFVDQLRGSGWHRVVYGPNPEMPQMANVAAVGTTNAIALARYQKFLFAALHGRDMSDSEYQQLMWHNFGPMSMLQGAQPEQRRNPLYAMLGSEALVTPQSILPEPPSLPRCWVSRHAIVEADDAKVRQALLGLRDVSANVWVARGGGADPSPAAGAPEIASFAPDEVTVELNGAGGWLTLAEAWYPGWSVTVDGEARELLRGNSLFRTVAVRPGERVASFRYRDPDLTRGWPWVLLGLGWTLPALVWRRKGESR